MSSAVVRQSNSSLLAALRLALLFAATKLLLQFALTLWTQHIGYSYFRDEFYYIACGRHLAWGFVDHGPIVALQAGVSIPFVVVGHWDQVAENVESVTETGTETLPLNGAPSSCRVLQVQYKSPADAPKPAPVTYSICSDKHVVLKKVTLYATGCRSREFAQGRRYTLP